ncbi:unnamed protein product, partial [Meganyctiphanes norvegica]
KIPKKHIVNNELLELSRTVSTRQKKKMANPLRTKVLSLYRSVVRLSKTWEAKESWKTDAERQYIITEAQELFRANKKITEMQEIEQCLHEGEARIEMAIHYRTPYPRPVNMPPQTITASWGKRNKKRQQNSRPIYIKSIDNT